MRWARLGGVSLLTNHPRIMEMLKGTTTPRPLLTLALPPGHWQIAEAESRLGAHLAAHGAPAEAAALLRAAVRTLDATRGPADRYARDARRALDSLRAAAR